MGGGYREGHREWRDGTEGREMGNKGWREGDLKNVIQSQQGGVVRSWHDAVSPF